MITVSLDESSGKFESFIKGHEKDVPFVAGLIFDDLGISGELEAEKKRIKSFLGGICNELNIKFPNDMHVNRGTKYGDPDYNGAKVGNFKNRMNQSKGIQDFFKLDRKGKYYIYANIKSNKGKTNLISLPDGFVDDSYRSNLYIHMVEDVFSKIILYNPLINNNTGISISFASRSTPVLNDDQKDDYRSVGYSIRDKDKVAFVGTGDVYRTSLNREIIASGKNDIRIDSFNVVSIDYGYRRQFDRKPPLTEQETIEQGFLYLADIICDYLGHMLSIDDSNIIEKIADRAGNLVPTEQTIIFGYDDIESEFMRSWVFTENGDLYKALDCAYDALRSNGQFTDYYRNRWYPILYQKMTDELTQNAFEFAVKNFGNSARSNNVNPNKLRFIYEHLETMVKTLDRCSSEALYELYDTGFSAFNHVGDSNKAEECFEECKKYSSEVGIERYFNTMNKYVVSLQDRFRYDEALEYASECEATQSRIHEALDDKYNSIAVKSYAKTISQLGQVYASLRNPKANEKFKEALFLLRRDTADYYITESYLLHHLIDMGERDEYEKYASDYFCDHSVEEQLDFILEYGRDGKRFSLAFAMFIHIKALYMFYIHEVSDSYLEVLLNNEYFLDSINKDRHPWEMIYKYLALIALHKEDNSKFLKYWNYSKLPYEKSEDIVKAIVIHNNIELMDESGVGDVEAEWSRLEDIVHTEIGASYLKTREDLNNAFTYMYK